MRRRHLRRACALAATTILTVSLAATTTSAAPDAGPSVVQGDVAGHGDVDNRGAAASPSDRQRSLAGQTSTTVRWNLYGTPATLLPRADLQRRGPDSDPVAVARAFLTSNRAAFGVSEAGVG